MLLKIKTMAALIIEAAAGIAGAAASYGAGAAAEGLVSEGVMQYVKTGAGMAVDALTSHTLNTVKDHLDSTPADTMNYVEDLTGGPIITGANSLLGGTLGLRPNGQTNGTNGDYYADSIEQAKTALSNSVKTPNNPITSHMNNTHASSIYNTVYGDALKRVDTSDKDTSDYHFLDGRTHVGTVHSDNMTHGIAVPDKHISYQPSKTLAQLRATNWVKKGGPQTDLAMAANQNFVRSMAYNNNLV